MRLTDHALDEIATELSSFVDPDIPELRLRDDKTLQNHMLESIIGVFSGKENKYIRYLVGNMTRRIFSSIENYNMGRAFALKYTGGDRHSVITPYFLAIGCFECCISYSWQVADLAHEITSQNIFEPGDDSGWERLHSIYTFGTKHSHEEKDLLREPPPTTIWLTNEGVACMNGSAVTYQELTEIIAANNQLFYDIQGRVHETVKQHKNKS